MAREKKIVVGAINITMQPHTPELYVQLFRFAFKQRKIVKINKTVGCLLAGFSRYKWSDDDIEPVTGDVWRFTHIDMDSPWVNIDTNDIATDEELNDINIPENLRPNGNRFSYIFYPENHMLFYEAYYDGNRISPKVVEKFFIGLFSSDAVVKKFGEIEVTHFPDYEGLEEALKIPFKKRIEVTYKRPNPDNFAKKEKKVLNRMKKLNISRKDEVYIAEKDGSIDMDENLKIDTMIAAKNGSLTIQGRDHNNKPENYTTKNALYTHTDYYDPKEEPIILAFMYRITTKLRDLLIDKLTK